MDWMSKYEERIYRKAQEVYLKGPDSQAVVLRRANEHEDARIISAIQLEGQPGTSLQHQRTKQEAQGQDSAYSSSK